MTRSEPLVSIVVNNYNYGRYLARAIDSALAQDYRNMEVVVVDDGSTDESCDVIDSYGGRIVALRKTNGGQASAVNAGFSASRGDIVLFLDSDDFLATDAASSVAKCFIERPELSKVHFRLTVVDEASRPTGGVLPGANVRLPAGDMLERLAAGRTYTTPPMSGNAYRRSAIAGQMPIPEQTYRKGADEWLICTAPIFGPVAAIDRALGYYRIHSSNVTHRNELGDGERFAAHVEEAACLRRRQAELFDRLLHRRIDAIAPRDMSHIRQLLSLRKLYPEHWRYPWRPMTLLLFGVRATILKREVRFADRVLWTLWFVAVATLPRGSARPMILAAFDAARRPPLLRRLLGRRGRR
jgi:hypothetical protein